MRRAGTLLLLLLLLSGLGCSRQATRVNTDVEEWRLVLHAKKASLKADDPATRQAYADRLLKFVQQHPDHGRARQVYDQLELDLARDLMLRGEYDGALRYLRDVAARSPDNPRLMQLRTETNDRRSVDRGELATVHNGMGPEEVRKLLGAPPTGWIQASPDGRYESWLYRNSQQGIASIHFDRGRVFAVDYDSPVPPKH